jgi:hypothetical protein
MSADVLNFHGPEEDVAIEPEDVAVEIEPDDVAIEPEPDPPAAAVALEPGVVQEIAPLPLVEVLPADFKLPALVKFVPNPALRAAADQAGTYALSLSVEGREGIERADVALTAVRTSLKAITDTFEEPCQIANALHKRLTGLRAEWCERGEQAIKTVGQRIYTEQRRLEAVAAEERRKAQAEADRQAREAARREAEAAAKAQAPAPVVEELKRQAETVTAPPVAAPAPAPVLRGSTTVTTWKARIVGTPGSDDPNPSMGNLTPAQRAEILKLFKAVLEGSAPMTAFEINWSMLNGRVRAEKSAFTLPGIEAFEAGSVRAKSTRVK